MERERERERGRGREGEREGERGIIRRNLKQTLILCMKTEMKVLSKKEK